MDENQMNDGMETPAAPAEGGMDAGMPEEKKPEEGMDGGDAA